MAGVEIMFFGGERSVEAASYFLMQLTLHPATAQAADNSLLEEHNGTVGRCLLAWPLRSAIAIRLVGAQCAYAKHILSAHPPSQRASEGAARVTASTFALNVVARTRAMPFRPIVDFCRDQTNTFKINLQSIHSFSR